MCSLHVVFLLLSLTIGLFWWWAGFELGLFASVPVLSLVVLLDAAVPTAQNIVMLILVHGKPEHGHVSKRTKLCQSACKNYSKLNAAMLVDVLLLQALAYVLLWQYAISVPVLIVTITIFLSIIQQVSHLLGHRLYKNDACYANPFCLSNKIPLSSYL